MSIQSLLDSLSPLEVCVEVDSARRRDLLLFDSSGDYVDFGDILNQGPTDSFTVEIVLDTSTLATDKVLVSKRLTGVGLQFYVSSGNDLVALLDDGVDQVLHTVPITPYIDSQEHIISIIVNRTSQLLKVLVDGGQLGGESDISLIGSLSNSTSLRVGSRGDDALSWSGILREFRFWSTARTQAQIQATLRSGSILGNESDLALYASMDEGQGSKVYDHTVNAYHGMITGATWSEVLKTWYFSTHARSTGAAETPANTSFLTYLLPHGSIGPLARQIVDDVLFSRRDGQINEIASGQQIEISATVSPGTLTVVQSAPTSSTDQLSQAVDYSFAGRQVRVKLGTPNSVYSTFDTYDTLTCESDPEIIHDESGLRLSWSLASALSRLLSEPLTVPRYPGISTCARIMTTSGGATISRIAAYDLTRYTVFVRFRKVVAGNPSSNTALYRKGTLPTSDTNWNLRMLPSGKVEFLNTSGGISNVSITSPLSYADANWHWIAASNDAAVQAYSMINGVVIGFVVPLGSPDLSVQPIQIGFLGSSADDIEVCDVRLYDRFIRPDEMRALGNTRADSSDLGIIGLWPFNDNAGSAGNDESSNNNDAIFGGVLNTDHSWQPSDLGEPELAGRPYPIHGGEIYNAPAQLIDGNRERYRLSDEDPNQVTAVTVAVRSQGTTLTGGGTDYTLSESDRIAQMTSQEGEPVTFDYLHNTNPGSSYPTTIARDLLINRTRLLSSQINNRYLSMDTLAPWRSGYYADSDTNAAVMLRSILGAASMHYFEASDGTLWIDMLVPPAGYGPYGEPAYDFNGGISVDITFGDIASVSGSHTLAGWFWTPAIDGSTTEALKTYIIGKADSNDNYALYFQSYSGQFTRVAHWPGSGSALLSPINPLEVFTWYFLAAVFDNTANTATLYIGRRGGDLVQVSQATGVTGSPGIGSELIIGSNQNESSTGWGAVQHVQVWNTVKTLVQLKSLMATPPVGNESGLVAYIPLTEGSGSPVERVTSITGTIRDTDPTTSRWAPRLLFDLDANPSIRLTEFRRALPAEDVIVRYNQNRKPMSASEIDVGVAQSTRWDLMREWKELPILGDFPRHRSTRRAILNSSLNSRPGAYRLARTLATKMNDDRFVGVIECPAGHPLSRRACGLQIGEEIGIKRAIPAILSRARSFRIIGTAHDPLNLSTQISFWG